MPDEIKLPNIPEKTRASIGQNLLSWYYRTQRDLPWRRTSDPYRILISEHMLQQTRVDTVIPYYHRFLERFPTVRDLADAPQADVLKAWEGLGYYARARNLHHAAQIIVDRHAGQIPDTYDALSDLPGFGPYTTAAVLSIAHDRPYAVLDGNVIRVLCRLFGISEDVTRTPVKNRLWDLARTLLPPESPGAYNQAVMELGATVCTPRNPACSACPVSALCRAFASGTPETLPVKAPRKTRPHHTMGVGIVWKEKKILIARRPEDGLLGGLWEFPAARRQNGESLQACCLRGIREETGVVAEIRSRFRTVKHAFTHFGVSMHAFHCAYKSGTPRPLGCAEVGWEAPADLGRFAFSRANRKLIDFLLQTEQPELFS